jgi:hypothetical protein
MDTLHIYGQDAWHDTAYIVGDRQSLAALLDCLAEALYSGEATKFNSFTNDGEGYTIEVIPLGEPQMETMRLPYHGDIAIDNNPKRTWPHVLVAANGVVGERITEREQPVPEQPVPEQPAPEKPKFLEVSAKVRYWEDAHVNGDRDIDGTLMPFRNGDLWVPTIRLSDGKVMDWPEGMTARVYYKVCDGWECWLRSASRRLFKCRDYYVPDPYLCHGDEGYGDYIILNIGPDGIIKDWREPRFDPESWDLVVPD